MMLFVSAPDRFRWERSCDTCWRECNTYMRLVLAEAPRLPTWSSGSSERMYATCAESR